MSHEAESFAQRECDVITARPIAQKTLRAFASVHRTPTRLGSVLLRQTQLASLQQVSSPNSQDNFQICCADMNLVRLLANFAWFCVFLWIARDFADLLEIRSSATGLEKWKLLKKNCNSGFYAGFRWTWTCFFNLCWIWSTKTPVSSFYKENNFNRV